MIARVSRAAADMRGDGALAIICGGGSLPFAVARAVAAQGRKAVLFAVRGSADAGKVSDFAHEWVAVGQFGRLKGLMRAADCTDVIFIGALQRPALRDIRLDLATVRLLPRLARALRGGDDHLLRAIALVFEDNGFRLRGAHEVAPEILMPAGTLGRREPSDSDRADIKTGLALLAAMAPYDVGQAVVVADQLVLATEAAEGTDLMLARVAELRGAGRLRVPKGRGVLVKAPKTGQDRRFDLPSLGPRTVEGAARAGLAGIAVVAGETVVAEPERVVIDADRENLFIVAVGPA